MRDKLQKAFVLFIIGAISGLSIWATNLVTFEQIDLNIENREKGFYKEILEIDPDAEITFIELEITSTFSELEIKLADGTVVGYVYKGIEKNSYGKVTTLVGIIDDEVKNVIISDSTNTPNYIKRIEKLYLSPFMGQDTSSVTFDTQTGASFTYGSVSESVVEATEYYNTERGGE